MRQERLFRPLAILWCQAITLSGFLFLSSPDSAEYFNYLTILILAIIGGLLGTLLMIPLRKALIVNEHENLPYPEGTACGDVLKAGEKGGDLITQGTPEEVAKNKKSYTAAYLSEKI